MNFLKPTRTDLISDLSRNFDKLLSSFDDFTVFSNSDLSNYSWIPKVDIEELDNQYKIYADIPGIDPSAIELNVENGILTIKGKKETKIENKDDKNNFLRIERKSGSFMRQMTLPGSIDAQNVKAKSKNGVLEIIIPKAEKNSIQKIPIE